MEGADADTRKRTADDIAADGEAPASAVAPDAKKAKVAEPDAPAQAAALEVATETEAEAKEGPNETIAEAAAAAAAVAAAPMIVEDAATAAAPATAVTQEGAAPAAIAKPETPLTIGFKTFKGGAECLDYYHHLLGTLTKNKDLNEYEFVMLSELIRVGHPAAASKIGAGMRAIQIKEHYMLETTCFYVMRTDGSTDDFSYRKCVANLYPDWDMLKHTREAFKGSRGRGGGRGGGGGRGAGGGDGGRGRGGRGGGRGRGRGRGR